MSHIDCRDFLNTSETGPKDWAIRDIVSALQGQHIERKQNLYASAQRCGVQVDVPEPDYTAIAEKLLEAELYRPAVKLIVERIRKQP